MHSDLLSFKDECSATVLSVLYHRVGNTLNLGIGVDFPNGKYARIFVLHGKESLFQMQLIFVFILLLCFSAWPLSIIDTSI